MSVCSGAGAAAAGQAWQLVKWGSPAYTSFTATPVTLQPEPTCCNNAKPIQPDTLEDPRTQNLFVFIISYTQ